MTVKTPRIIIAGTHSGSGKTTVTCAVMRALVNKGIKVSPFKCGPDYIDPMFHTAVTGVSGGNIDTFLFNDNTAKYLLAKNAQGHDISVIEGVMGYYDGAGTDGSIAGTFSVADATKTPVVLVVNCKGLSFSAAAMIKGFVGYRKSSYISGVILNNISPHVYELIKPVIEDETGIKVFGFLPKLPDDCIFESRRLGLVTPAELVDIHTKLDLLAKIAADNIDLDGLMKTASEAPCLSYEKPAIKQFSDKVKIAMAEDKAFCFIYRDNIDLLKEMGAKIIPFSPLTSDKLPEDISGLLLYGGYPELYLDELSGNTSLLNDIHIKLTGGLPCIAECGGFMYLNRSIEGKKMVGFLESDCYKTNKLVRFGYAKIIAMRDNMLCANGESINAHEYHYFDCTDPGVDFTALKPTGREWKCIVAQETLFAGFPHIHFYGNLQFAEGFYEKCLEFGKKQNAARQSSFVEGQVNL